MAQHHLCPQLTVKLSSASEANFNAAKATLAAFDKHDSLIKVIEATSGLEIPTDSRTLHLQNINPDTNPAISDDQKVEYKYLGYDKAIQKHLIKVDYYEGDNYLLLDHKTAKMDTLSEYPNFSHTKRFVFTAYSNPYNDKEINGEFVYSGDIEVLQLCNNNLEHIHSKSYDFIPLETRWLDDYTIIIKAVSAKDYTDVQSDVNKKLSDFKCSYYMLHIDAK